MFINAAEYFEKGKRQNHLLPEHIGKIIDTYQFRKEETKYSQRVSMEEIDLMVVHEESVSLDKKIKEATDCHNSFLKELRLPLLS